MMNLIRADTYRILRGKAIYITFAILFAITALMVLGLRFSLELASQHLPAEEFLIVEEAMTYAFGGMEGFDMLVQVLLTAVSILPYFMIALISLTSCDMFTHGTVKNSLSRGMCRVKLYVSKLVLSSVLTLVLLVFYVLSGMVMVFLAESPVSPLPWSEWVFTLVLQYLILLAITFVGVSLAFIIRSEGAFIGAFIAFCLVPQVIFGISAFFSPNFEWLINLDFLSTLTRLSGSPFNIDQSDSMLIIGVAGLSSPPYEMTYFDYILVFSTAIFYSIIATAAGITLFRKAEIK